MYNDADLVYEKTIVSPAVKATFNPWQLRMRVNLFSMPILFILSNDFQKETKIKSLINRDINSLNGINSLARHILNGASVNLPY